MTTDVKVEGESLPFVSVIIATRNRPDSLVECVRSVLGCDYPDFEVIVVDQTEGNSAEAFSAIFGDPRLRVHIDSGKGKSRGENIAVGMARAQILIFTDDDCTVPTTWLRRVVQVFAAEPKVGMVFGAVKAAPHDASTTFIPVFLPKAYSRIDGGVVRQHPAVMGANVGVRRQVFDALHAGFETRLGPGSRFRSGDDWELAYRALKAGFDVLFDPDNEITHWGARTYEGGQASRLLRNNYFGIGAGYALHARQGDWGAMLVFARLATSTGVEVGLNAVRMRRPLGIARFFSLFHGAASALLDSSSPNASE